MTEWGRRDSLLGATTGTPPGVGAGIKPKPQFLQAGDVITLGISGLGEQTQKVVKFKR